MKSEVTTLSWAFCSFNLQFEICDLKSKTANFFRDNPGLTYLTESWKRLKKYCFPERFTLLEIPVVTTQT